MNMPTLLSVLILTSIASSAGFAQADPNQTTSAAPATGAAPAGCLQATGSRIPQEATKCAAAGNSHTGKDLRDTGKPSVSDGLKMLDPAISVH
jgi:hypothetical protein